MAMSLDGYVAGPDQSLEDPLGVGGPRLHDWMFETRTGREMIVFDALGEVADGYECAELVRGESVVHARVVRTAD